MDWTDISITCVCIKHSFSLPSNEFTVKCVGRVTVAEKNLCDVKCTFLSKKLSLPPGKLVFSPLFSQLHTFLPWFQVVRFGGFFCSGYSNTSSQKEQTPVCKCFGSWFSEQYKKSLFVLGISRHVVIYFSAVQHPCSVFFIFFFLAVLKCLGNYSDLHCFTLFSWPPGPQYVHQSSSFEIRRIWKQAGLALGNKIIKWVFSFLWYPPNLSVSKTLQKQSVHWVNRSVFITEILPLPHGLSQGLFGHLPNRNILACRKTSNR